MLSYSLPPSCHFSYTPFLSLSNADHIIYFLFPTLYKSIKIDPLFFFFFLKISMFLTRLMKCVYALIHNNFLQMHWSVCQLANIKSCQLLKQNLLVCLLWPNPQANVEGFFLIGCHGFCPIDQMIFFFHSAFSQPVPISAHNANQN